MPRVLIVSYAYPRPGAGWGSVVGGERMRQFARLLPAHGIDTCVLTHRGRTGHAEPGTYAAPDVTRWLAERLREGQPAADGVRDAPRGGWRLSALRTRARRWLVPDRASFAWAPWAVASGVRVFERERPDLVLSSSPPIAAHLVACALAARFAVPWIADVRDGYAFEPPEGQSPVRAARRALERQLYARAARLLAVTDALRDDFRGSLPLPAAQIVTLGNGYDADLIQTTPLPPRAAEDPCTILYAGSTSFGAGRDLAGFLRGVDRFAARAEGPVRVRLMGLFAGRELPELQRAELEPTGWRPREEVAEALRSADVLAVLTGNQVSVATTKLFEYIGAGRPILVVGRRSAAARIVLEHELGAVADDDPQSIACALEALQAQRERWRAHLGSEAMQRVRRSFSRQGQAALLAQHVREVLAQRAR